MGYVGACRDAGITPPDWSKQWQYLRPWDLKRRKPGYAAYKRMGREVHGINSTHMPAADVKNLVGEKIWRDYFKFTFERHPVDRVISFFNWRTRKNRDRPSIEEFIVAIESGDKDFLKRHKLCEFSNLENYSINGEICVDFMGRFEQLSQDMSKLSELLKIKWDGWMPNEKRSLGSHTDSSMRIVNSELRRKLSVIMETEMKLLGYTL